MLMTILSSHSKQGSVATGNPSWDLKRAHDIENSTTIAIDARTVGIGLLGTASALVLVHLATMLLWFGDFLPFED